MHSKENSTNRGAARFAGMTLGATLCASAFLSGQAQAADGPAGVPDYQGARQVLRSATVHDTISRFLNATNSAGNSGADGGQQDAAPMDAGSRDAPQTFSLKDPVAIYEITPDFVSGKTKPTPAGCGTAVVPGLRGQRRERPSRHRPAGLPDVRLRRAENTRGHGPEMASGRSSGRQHRHRLRQAGHSGLDGVQRTADPRLVPAHKRHGPTPQQRSEIQPRR